MSPHVRPRTSARLNLIRHVEAGGDEHPHVVETLRAVVEQTDQAQLSMYAADALIAETVRGLIEGLDELDARTEALLREALNTPCVWVSPAPPGLGDDQCASCGAARDEHGIAQHAFTEVEP